MRKTVICQILLALLMLLGGGNLHAQGQLVSLNLDRVPLETALNSIKQQTNYLFVNMNVDTRQTVSAKVDRKGLREALDAIFTPIHVDYKIEGTTIVIAPKPVAQTPQNRVVRGRMTDAQGEPVIGGAVVIAGTTIGTSADLDGNFEFTVPAGHENGTLEFSTLGYTTVSLPIDGRARYDVVMQEESTLLEGTVVTALGIRRAQKALSYNVQEVKSDEILSTKDANFINSLSGKAAGLVINASSVGVGGATKAVMRGSKSITKSSNALYVIDGVPMGALNREASETSFDSKGFTDPIADLNPEDIESMTVLTGAAAAALYGQDGANGAIVITTKKGQAGKTSLTIASNTEISQVTFLPKFQDRYGTGDYLSSGGSTIFSWGRKLNDLSYTGYDPAKDYFQTGVTATESVSFSTGTDKNQTYLSAAALNATGVVPNNAYNRYNFSVRNTTNFLNDRMTLDVAFQYIMQDDRNMITQGQYGNPLVSAYLFPRGASWEDVKMYERWDNARQIYTQYWPYGEGGMVMQNPYWINYRQLRTNKKDRYLASAGLTWKMLEWLSATGRVRIDNAANKYEQRSYATTNQLLTGGSENGYYSIENISDKQVYADAMLDIHKPFGDNWNLQANLGAILVDYRNEATGVGGAIGNGTIGAKNLPNVFNVYAIGVPHPNAHGYHDQTQSIYGQAEIGYKGAWYLTMTARNDWDSRLFGPGSTKHSFFYPSVGVSGVLSQAFQLPKAIEFLKVRASWAQVGTAYQRWIANPIHEWDGSQQSWKTQTAYPVSNLKPEMTTSWEVGLQSKFKGGFSLDLSWYLTDTMNQTFNPGISSGSGYSDIYIQSGDVRNTGIELALGYEHTWGKFTWNSNYTFSTNANKIVFLADDVTNPVTGETFSVSRLNMSGLGAANFILKKGGSLGDLYSRADLQRDDRGDIYINENGNVTVATIGDVDDYIKLGSVLPDANMAWRNEFRLGGFALSAMLQARLGGVVFSGTQANLDRFGVSEASALARDNGGVLINGDDLYDPNRWFSTIGGGDMVPQFYTYDATNVRLAEAAIGYTFPRKLFGDLFDLTLQVVGRNLLMIYCKAPFDPETTATTTNNYYQGIDYFMMPGTRNLGFNVRINFGGTEKSANVAAPAYVAPYVANAAPVEVVKEVVKEVPVEVVKEIVKEVPTRTELYVTDLNFLIGKAELGGDESFKLGRMFQTLKENPSAKVELTGYADSATGTEELNRTLAKQRAHAVAEKLIAEGIDASRISYTFAEGDWNASASPEANRRVTVRIVNE